MDRDTLIFIAFCVFILLLGVRFWQQLRERTERTEADRSIADEAVPLPAKSRRCYFILIQVIVLGGLLIYMLPWLIRDFKGTECWVYFTLFDFCIHYLYIHFPGT